MREEHLTYLRCPLCRCELTLADKHDGANGRVQSGLLLCGGCGTEFPIVDYVPRFVDEGYTQGFGLQWNLHRRTQYDAYSGMRGSESRFFEETGWPRRLEGEILLEAGSGSGRFTEHAAETGALVLSLEHSRAVDANYGCNGHRENLLLVQGDLYRMPFAADVADRLFCFGVLQHTPVPPAALRALVGHLRPGGNLVADIYLKSFGRYVLGTKYWVRPLTRRIPPSWLYRMVSRYIDVMWPLARRIRRIPKIGRAVNWRLLIADHSDVLRDDEMLRDWARLDTFDMLAPRYDKPATLRAVRRWCQELGLESIEVQRGYNGLEIRARRPPRRVSVSRPVQDPSRL